MPNASRRDLLRAIRFLLANLLILCFCAFAAAAQEPPVPSPGCGPGHPKPDARMVTLAQATQGTAGDVLARLTARAQLVAIGNATAIRPRANSGKSKVEAYQEVAFSIVRTLKATAGLPTAHAPIHVWAYGGTALQAGRCVEWIGPGENIKTGSSYILFAGYVPSTRRFYGTDWFEIIPGGLVRSLPQTARDSALDGSPLAQLLSRIASELARQSKGRT